MMRFGTRLRPEINPLHQRPERAVVLILLACLGIGVSPHLSNLNPVFIGLFYLFLASKAVITFYPCWQPRRWLLLPLTLGGFVLVLVLSRPLVSSETGISLLMVMTGLKLLEITQRRDIQFSILLGFFVMITVFIFEEAIEIMLLMLLVSVGLVALLIRINTLGRPSYSEQVLLALKLSVQAIPLTLLLFFVFPRLNAPLWAFHTNENVARTGLSDEVSPGTISNLIRSSEIAFRAEFDQDPPTKDQLYWRGPVMWQTDGRTWTRNEAMMRPTQENPVGSASVSYRVFLEPTDKHWLLLLDLPAKVSDKAIITGDYQVISRTPINKTRAYRATSYTEYLGLSLDEWQRQLALQLPERVSDRVRDLAESWKAGSNSDREIVQQALRHFREQPFVYTLNPPLLLGDPSDGFLFETRRGFCEHYATSFTLLMRLAGIPSRLVTGYLGGELNPGGEYLVVRQSDAHAWSEVWLESEGWVRVDPTAAVAPERVEQSIDISSLEGAALFVVPSNSFTDLIARNVRWGVDALNMSWYRWVIGYDRDRQRNLLSNLGLQDLPYRALGYLAAVIPVIVLLIYYLVYFHKDRGSADPVQQAFQRLMGKLAKIGLVKPATEGALSFFKRLKTSHPALASRLKPLIQDYVQLRYGRADCLVKQRFIEACKRFDTESG